MQDFEVIAAGIPATPYEWSRAMQLPVDELPVLSGRDLQDVERFNLNAETSRRHVAMREFARGREKHQGEALGAILQNMLRELGSEFVVTLLQRVSPPDGWFIRLLGDSREVRLSLDLESADGLVVGSISNRELNEFEHRLAELVEPRSLRSRHA